MLFLISVGDRPLEHLDLNSLSSAASQVEASWAQVENQLQRRADLIPNLISVTQAYARQEKELADTENRLAVERMRYNRAVQAYNQKIQGFPNSLLAKALGFQNQSFFQATTTEAPKTPRQ